MIDLIIMTIFISMSGALSPGPLTASTIVLGLDGGWKKGFYVAIGHTIVELPFIFLLGLIMDSILVYLNIPSIKMVFSIFISIFIGYFAYLSLLDAYRGNIDVGEGKRIAKTNPIYVGVILTGLNPYFLLWWATVGIPIIQLSLGFGLVTGILLMYVFHVWLDYLWLSLMAYLPYSGRNIFGEKFYRAILAIVGIILLIFMVEILINTFLI
jgi:threonine/homoserine/homoserine lactone efflux protein